jgi:hypothetical protein
LKIQTDKYGLPVLGIKPLEVYPGDGNRDKALALTLWSSSWADQDETL